MICVLEQLPDGRTLEGARVVVRVLHRQIGRFVEAVGRHHAPGLATHAVLDASIIHVADALANRSELGAFFESGIKGKASIAQSALDVTRLTGPDVDEGNIIGEAGIQFTETVGLLLAKTGP